MHKQIFLFFRIRENLLVQLASLNHDLIEYSKNPVETVDLIGLKYQHSFTLKEIQRVDQQIKTCINSQYLNYKNQFIQTEKKINEAVEKKKEFSVSDLPKNHFSFWQNLED